MVSSIFSCFLKNGGLELGSEPFCPVILLLIFHLFSLELFYFSLNMDSRAMFCHRMGGVVDRDGGALCDLCPWEPASGVTPGGVFFFVS